MRCPTFNGTRGCAKLAPKHATDNRSKDRIMAKNAIRIVVLVKSEWCELGSLWRENDGLNNGTCQGDVKGPNLQFGFSAFFWSTLTRAVPLLNPLFGVDCSPLAATTEYQGGRATFSTCLRSTKDICASLCLTSELATCVPLPDSSAYIYIYMLLYSIMGCFFSPNAFENAPGYAFENGVRSVRGREIPIFTVFRGFRKGSS